MWDHQVAALSGQLRCLRVDMWGCGSSPAPPGEPGFASYAAAVLDAMDARDAGSFAVVACSMGAYVAWELLRAAPARVTSLTLVGARANADTDEGRAVRAEMIQRVERDGVEAILEEYVSKLVSAKSHEEPHITDPLRARIRGWTPEGVIWALRAISFRPDSTELLGVLRAPTLVVAGAEDVFMPAAGQEAMAQAIPGARFERFDGCGHLPNLENPPAFNDQLLSHLAAAVQQT